MAAPQIGEVPELKILAVCLLALGLPKALLVFLVSENGGAYSFGLPAEQASLASGSLSEACLPKYDPLVSVDVLLDSVGYAARTRTSCIGRSA